MKTAKRALARCEAERRAGAPYLAQLSHAGYKGWADSGGLSEASTQHLVSFLFPQGDTETGGGESSK